ncbi:MAG: bifunctional adenosylcobinamide kinase/adenosylcobinamide-phosphate guanylyltransferase [Propionicimonas sp.]|uniref:bifunctional adenosylcobinamide kinase/adenosylcobinamide-phosphate guanylyltransferase n=1 Tax=Propionicimonas sp. TaxID=1955623 RepID=UPI003D153333
MTHVLVTGGVRSGKSRYAECLMDAAAPVTYLTPGYPADPARDAEWAARVAAHRLRRPGAWRTVETLALAGELAAADGPVLVDCLGTWLTRLLDSWQAWDADDNAWLSRLADETDALADAVRTHPHDVVLVTNEVGWGLVSEYRAGRLFADNLGRINQAIGAACDQVVLLVAGRPLTL